MKPSKDILNKLDIGDTHKTLANTLGVHEYLWPSTRSCFIYLEYEAYNLEGETQGTRG